MAASPWQTAWGLFNKWNADGTWNGIAKPLRGEVDLDDEDEPALDVRG